MDPIFLIGTARSGTTFLGRTALARADDLCYWGEPNHVWMHGHAYRRHDELSEADATPGIARYIRDRFEQRLASSGAKVLLEKTPANCLRLPFLQQIFPEARYIYLLRDGRSVVRSAINEWRGEGSDARDSRDLRQGGTVARVGKGTRAYFKIRERLHDLRDLFELPAYGPRFVRFVLRNSFPGRDYLWGPRFSGIRQYRKQHSLAETCAEQWRRQLLGMQAHRESIASGRFYELRFEHLMAEPRQEISRLIGWMGVSIAPEVLDSIIGSVDVCSGGLRRDPLAGLADVERQKVEAIIVPLQREIGYS